MKQSEHDTIETALEFLKVNLDEVREERKWNITEEDIDSALDALSETENKAAILDDISAILEEIKGTMNELDGAIDTLDTASQDLHNQIEQMEKATEE